MYKKILITTDGSAISNAVVKSGVALAAQLGAQVTGLFVAANYQYPMDVDFLPVVYPAEQDYRASMEKLGATHLEVIRQAAHAAGLAFTGFTAFSDATAQQIISCAQEQDCDLIYMGSHGRGGWGQLLLGSVTNKVLSSCTIPVLVDRLRQAPQ